MHCLEALIIQNEFGGIQLSNLVINWNYTTYNSCEDDVSTFTLS